VRLEGSEVGREWGRQEIRMEECKVGRKEGVKCIYRCERRKDGRTEGSEVDRE
jgi:hypothetical protein